MKWYIWVLVVAVVFAAGYFTGDMVAKNTAKKLAAKKTVNPSTGLGTPPATSQIGTA